MHNIMRICFESVKGKLTRRLGYFELYGFDFMVDDNMKVRLLEVRNFHKMWLFKQIIIHRYGYWK